MEQHFLDNKVDIEIALYSEVPDMSEITPSLDAVFIKPDDRMADIVPEYWREYFNKLEGSSSDFRRSTETVYRVKEGEVLPPRVVYEPQPEFSEQARISKFHGKVSLSLVVDASGSTTDIQIDRPLGLGLDEKAVEAIRSWKFMPATKGVQPVPVAIMVETEFYLY